MSVIEVPRTAISNISEDEILMELERMAFKLPVVEYTILRGQIQILWVVATEGIDAPVLKWKIKLLRENIESALHMEQTRPMHPMRQLLYSVARGLGIMVEAIRDPSSKTNQESRKTLFALGSVPRYDGTTNPNERCLRFILDAQRDLIISVLFTGSASLATLGYLATLETHLQSVTTSPAFGSKLSHHVIHGVARGLGAMVKSLPPISPPPIIPLEYRPVYVEDTQDRTIGNGTGTSDDPFTLDDEDDEPVGIVELAEESFIQREDDDTNDSGPYQNPDSDTSNGSDLEILPDIDGAPDVVVLSPPPAGPRIVPFLSETPMRPNAADKQPQNYFAKLQQLQATTPCTPARPAADSNHAAFATPAAALARPIAADYPVDTRHAAAALTPVRPAAACAANDHDVFATPTAPAARKNKHLAESQAVATPREDRDATPPALFSQFATPTVHSARTLKPAAKYLAASAASATPRDDRDATPPALFSQFAVPLAAAARTPKAAKKIAAAATPSSSQRLVCDYCDKDDFVSAKGLSIHRSKMHKESVAREKRAYSVAFNAPATPESSKKKKKRMSRAISDEPDEVVRCYTDEKECSHCGKMCESNRDMRTHQMIYHGKL